jgi:hypothetical protein
MGKSDRFDRRGSGPWFIVVVALLTFFLYSLAVAVDTADDCGDLNKEWQIFPPEWECQRRTGFG